MTGWLIMLSRPWWSAWSVPPGARSWQGAALGCGVTRTRPIWGLRDLGSIGPPAAQPSPVAATGAPGNLADGRLPCRT